MVPKKLLVENTKCVNSDNKPMLFGIEPVIPLVPNEKLLTTPSSHEMPLQVLQGSVDGLPLEQVHPEIPVAAAKSHTALSDNKGIYI